MVAAVVLAGGRARRLGGRDKAGLTVAGQTLLDTTLAALAGCDPVVVVGPPHLAGRATPLAGRATPLAGRETPLAGRATPLAGRACRDHYPTVLHVQEDPPYGGPAAGLLTALGVIEGDGPVVVTAVDHPGLTLGTVARLLDAAAGDGAVLVDGDGRRQPVLVARAAALRAAAPGRDEWSGLSLRWLLEPLDLVEVAAMGAEALDVDTPADLERWAT